MQALDQTANEQDFSGSPDRPQDAADTAQGIDLVARLDRKTFAARYFRARKPVIITDMATHWPAVQKWSFDFFAGLDPERKVTLETGNVMQGETNFETARIADYLSKMEQEGGAAPKGDKKRYLSMFRVFEQFPHLKADVDFSLIEALTMRQIYFAWLGPAETLTGYHIDWIDNIFSQIRGRKRFTLVSPEQSRGMYPSRKYDYRSSLSEVEPNTWDRARHPLYAGVRPVQVVLEPGQMLFLPAGWWHRVEGLTPSISVNAFAQDWRGIIGRQAQADLLHGLHRLGLYGRADCPCHARTNSKTS